MSAQRYSPPTSYSDGLTNHQQWVGSVGLVATVMPAMRWLAEESSFFCSSSSRHLFLGEGEGEGEGEGLKV